MLIKNLADSSRYLFEWKLVRITPEFVVIDCPER